MALATDKPFVCPIVIGREGEIASLERTLEQVHGGSGHTLLLAGEAGVGKSRLVAAARARAEELGFLCLQGQCFEPDTALPFAPLIDLLRGQLAGLRSGALATHPSIIPPDLTRLLTELAALLPGIAPPPAWRDPEQEKRHLFHALTQSFVAQSNAQPLLAVVEDLHWSDDTSLEFLLSLARRVAHHPILLLLTYRNDEVAPGLRHLLAELDRGRLAGEIVLAPLTRPNLATMLEATLGPGRGAHKPVVDALHTLTGGNPYFIEEVLKMLAVTTDQTSDHGGVDLDVDRLALDDLRAPRSVADAVLRRLGRLSAPALRTLTLASVAGTHFDFSVLLAITQQDEGELLGYVKELVAAQLVVELSAERFAFRHALTRQAIYGLLLARERQALHRTIFAAIEHDQALPEETRLADLSYHAFKGGLWPQALTYARRMGEHALAVGAPQAATEQFARAFEATRHLGQPPAPELRRARGRAYEMRGDFERAAQDYASMLEAARQVGDRSGEWQALLDLGFLWQGRDYQRAGDFLRQARDLADRMDDPQRLAQSLNRLGNWYANMGQPHQARALHQQALAIFRDLDHQPGIAATLDLLAVTAFFGGDRRTAIAHFEEAAALLRELGDRQGLVSVLAMLGHARSPSRVNETVTGPAYSAAQAVADCEEALNTSREIGWRPGEAFALCELVACLTAAGEYGRALAAGQEGVAIAAEIEHRGWLTLANSGLGMAYLDLLAPHAARWHCEQAYMQARAVGSSQLISMAAAWLAWAYLLNEDSVRAEEVLRGLAPDVSSIENLPQSVLAVARGAVELALGNPHLALGIADRLIAWAELAGGSGITPRLAKLRGDALAALGRRDEAVAALESARAAAVEQGTRALLWQVHASLGALHRAQGRREVAEMDYIAARSVIEEMAAAVPDETLRERFRTAAFARLPALRAPSTRQLEREVHGGLTAREVEVAVLIARGHSNSEIAQAMVISERTVEAHSGHIRDKLGLTSRAQVAVWAVEHGLAQQDPTR